MRSPAWSADAAVLLAWPAVGAWAFAAERSGYAGFDVRHWLPDLCAGLIVSGAGLYAAQRERNRCAVLLALCGVLWFLPNFDAVAGPLGWLAAKATYLHRGPLIHVLISFPTGRLVSRSQRLAVGAGYLVAADPDIWAGWYGTAAATTGLGVLIVASGRGWPGRYRRARMLAYVAAAILALVILGTVSVRSLVSSEAVAYRTLLIYQLALAACAVLLVAGLRAKTWERAAFTDLVLGEAGGREAPLRDALAWALADPGLQIRFGTAGDAPVGGARTVVDRNGVPMAVIAHRPGLLTDTGLREAVAAAVRLGAENAALQEELEARVAEVTASRRRLLTAADEEAQRWEGRLSAGPLRKLAQLDEMLTDPELTETLAATIESLRDLAHGLYPRTLSERGLVAAVHELAKRCPIPVEVEGCPPPLPTAVETTAYFVCSEALANAVKHAKATVVQVSMRSADDVLRIEIADDGTGGAIPSAGSGLRGLMDRLDALGGTLALDSPPGHGTRICAALPVPAEAAASGGLA